MHISFCRRLTPLDDSKQPTYSNGSFPFLTDICLQTGSFPKPAARAQGRPVSSVAEDTIHPAGPPTIAALFCMSARKHGLQRDAIVLLCNVTCDSINDSGPCFCRRNAQIYHSLAFLGHCRILAWAPLAWVQEKQESRNLFI